MALTDIIFPVGDVSVLVVAAGPFNPADEIVSDHGSIIMVIPAGTVNSVIDVVTEGDYDQIPETELVSVPNVIMSGPRKVR